MNSPLLARKNILDNIHLLIIRIQGPIQRIMRNVLQMTLILQPRAGRTNMIRRAFALHLQHDLQILEFTNGSRAKGFKDLETGGFGIDIDLDGRVGVRDVGGSVGEVSGDEAVLGEVISVRGLEHEFFARGVDQGIGDGVEGELS